MDNEQLNTETVENTGAEPKTYTEDEVKKLIQSEGDRMVSKALKTQQAKFEKQFSEAEKLRTMNDEQRKTYEFETKLAEFEQQKKDFAIMQNKLEASKILNEKSLPVTFVDYIVDEDAEVMMERINSFEQMFKSAVADAVTTKIGTSKPKIGTTKQTGLTVDEFKKMTLAQQSELYRTNKTLYDSLVKQTKK